MKAAMGNLRSHRAKLGLAMTFSSPAPGRSKLGDRLGISLVVLGLKCL